MDLASLCFIHIPLDPMTIQVVEEVVDDRRVELESPPGLIVVNQQFIAMQIFRLLKFRSMTASINLNTDHSPANTP